MQITAGRPKDLEKRARILAAAKCMFLKQGYHGSSMNQIASEAGVTKLTVYNHFQDKATLFTCAIEESCEEAIPARQFSLHAQSHFAKELYQVCSRVLHLIYLPEALKLEYILLQLAAEQSPLVEQFFKASHQRLTNSLTDFFRQAIELSFIQPAAPVAYTELLLSLLLGIRHQHVLLGMQPVPDQQERDCMIQQSIELFLLRYEVRSSPP